MMMANVLHRKKPAEASDVLPSAPDYIPASLLEPDPDDRSPAPWPVGAKIAVALLVVTTVAATTVAAIGFGSGDDGSAERDLRDEIATLTVDRDGALAAAGALDAEIATLTLDRDGALAAVGALDAEIATLRQNLLDARNGNEALTTDIAELESRIEALSDRRADAVAAADEANAALGAALTRVDGLEVALATERDRRVAAASDRDALAAMFPVKFTGSLGDVEMVGKYGAQLSQVYCSGLASCGTAPSPSEFAIRKNADGFLRLDGPGFVDVGLFRAGGALHAVAESRTTLPACDAIPRTANITMTMFPGRYELTAGGAQTVAGISAVVTVEAPATGSCPAATAFYGAELTPKA